MALNPTKYSRIFLWTAPRVCGTAFERCISQLDGVTTCGEPYFAPFYFGDQRQCNRFDHEIDDSCISSDIVGTFFNKKNTLEHVTNDLINDYNSKHEVLFYHEHAYHVLPHQFIPKTMLNNYINTFMIRDPNKSIKSLYRNYIDPTVCNENSFFWGDGYCGFKQLYMMFEIVTNELKQTPIIIDANDFMKEPKTMLQKYCSLTGLKYNDNMLEYNNHIEGWWNDTPWHRDLSQSKTVWSTDKIYSNQDDIIYPQMVYDCIDEAIPFYNELYKYTLSNMKHN